MGWLTRVSTVQIRTMVFKAVCVMGTAVALGLIVFVQPVWAHGEDRVLQLEDVAAGPYRLTVWTAPGILRTGEIHVEMAVLTTEGVPTLDVLVQVRISRQDGAGETFTVLAQPPQRGGVIQEAAFWLTQPGAYQMEVLVQGIDGSRGVAVFPVDVIAVPGVTTFLIYVQWLVALFAAVWLIRIGPVVWRRDQGDTLKNLKEKTTCLRSN